MKQNAIDRLQNDLKLDRRDREFVQMTGDYTEPETIAELAKFDGRIRQTLWRLFWWRQQP